MVDAFDKYPSDVTLPHINTYVSWKFNLTIKYYTDAESTAK